MCTQYKYKHIDTLLDLTISHLRRQNPKNNNSWQKKKIMETTESTGTQQKIAKKKFKKKKKRKSSSPSSSSWKKNSFKWKASVCTNFNILNLKIFRKVESVRVFVVYPSIRLSVCLSKRWGGRGCRVVPACILLNKVWLGGAWGYGNWAKQVNNKHFNLL